MFDIKAVKQELGIDTSQDEKAESGAYPRANRANDAKYRPKVSTFSTPPHQKLHFPTVGKKPVSGNTS